MSQSEKTIMTPDAHFMKSKSKRPLHIVLIISVIILLLIILLLIGAFVMFRSELRIINTLKPLDGVDNGYYMEVDGYCDDEIFSAGVSSDDELAGILAEKITKGFYNPESTGTNPVACSMLSGKDSDGKHIWGRNFDWADTPVIILILYCV